MWGSVYHRSGFVMQTDDDRAAAVGLSGWPTLSRGWGVACLQEVKGVKRDG
ncbi:hypothetical protein ECZU29_18760 [Escherichia coli]|nr:hypothetical protein ECZU29_18760 [Escherichia coli]